MNFEATYIDEQSNAGLILKGQTRNSNQPVHMILLCDTSGSMEQENKLNSVKRSITLLLSLLSPDDRLSLITFSDTSKIVLSSSTPSADNRQAIQYRVDSLEPEGSTNLSAGLLDIRTLIEPATSGRKQGVIVLTDGHANVGIVKQEGILEIVTRIQTESPGLSITTVAYGVDHNAEMLTALAKAGGGAYNVVKDLEDVATVFGDILGGLVSVSVQGVTVQLPPGVEPNTSYRYTKDATGTTTIYVGDIYADSELIVLFRGNGQLRIQATDMRTLDRIDEVLQPSPFGSPVPSSIHIADLRQQVAEIIKQAMTVFDSKILVSIETLLSKIEADALLRGNPIKPMLLEDLEAAKKIVQKKGRVGANETIEMLQHSAFLSMSKGLRSNTRAAPVASPFATRAQTQYASAMKSMSQQPNPDMDIV
jgi:uncharacterized protein YegL